MRYGLLYGVPIIDDIPETSDPKGSEGTHLSYEVANLQGIGLRKRQEDSFAISNAFDTRQRKEQGLFFAVCDGMGGMKDGLLASRTAMTGLRSAFAEMDRNGDLAFQLKKSILEASGQVEALIGGDGGSTVVAGIIYEDRLYFASVGDSFFYLFRDGALCRLNREQTLCHQNYWQEILEGGMDPSDYQDWDEAGALTGFLGMRGLEDVDACLRPMPLKSGDVLLACSDGVGGVLTEEDIKKALSFSTEQEMCSWMEERLVEYKRQNQDNYTAVVVKCI